MLNYQYFRHAQRQGQFRRTWSYLFMMRIVPVVIKVFNVVWLVLRRLNISWYVGSLYAFITRIIFKNILPGNTAGLVFVVAGMPDINLVALLQRVRKSPHNNALFNIQYLFVLLVFDDLAIYIHFFCFLCTFQYKKKTSARFTNQNKQHLHKYLKKGSRSIWQTLSSFT